MDDHTASKHIGTPAFDGKAEKFAMWWPRFTAFAAVKKFDRQLHADVTISKMPAKEGDYSTDADEKKEQVNAEDKNRLAMAYFTMAFTSAQLMGMIDSACDTDYQGGRASTVATLLLAKYRPVDRLAKVEMRQALGKIKLKKGEHPDVLFERLATVCNEYAVSAPVDMESQISVIMEKAPSKYSGVIGSEIARRGANLNLDNLQTAMKIVYRMDKAGNENDDDSDDDGTEMALQGTDSKVKCYNCGKEGHKAYQCKDSKRNNGKGKGQNGYDKKRKFNGKCNNCGKIGHMIKDCWEDEKNAHKRPKNWKSSKESGGAAVDVEDVEYVLNAVDDDELKVILCEECHIAVEGETKLSISDLSNEEYWVGDTGATAHIMNTKTGMFNIKNTKNNESMVMGNGSDSIASSIGDIKGCKIDKNGNNVHKIRITNIMHSDSCRFNLFSMSRMVNEGWKLSGDEDSLRLKKNEFELVFDIKVPTPKGFLYCMRVIRDNDVSEESGSPGVDKDIKTQKKKKTMNIKTAHDALGHMDEERTRKAAKQLGIEITRGTLKPCKDCAAGKAKQKNVPKVSNHVPSTKVNERIYLDIASIKEKKDDKIKNVNKPHCRIMVDEKTQMKIVDFFYAKSGMVEPTCEKIQKWKSAKMPVSIIRCDNAGENKKLKDRLQSKDWKLDIDFEFTARNTPQQNHLAEIGFTILFNRARAMMHRANIPLDMRYKVVREAIKTASLLDGLAVIELDGKTMTRFEHWSGKIPKFANHLKIYGEAGTVTLKSKKTPKIDDRGVQCMMVGYDLDHEGDCYRMYDPITERVHLTRDIIWLKKMFHKRPTELGNDEEVEGNSELDDVTPKEEPTDTAIRGNDASKVIPEPAKDGWTTVKTRSGRTINKPKRLIEEAGNIITIAEANYYSILADATEEEFAEDEPATIGSEIGCVGAGLGGGFENTNELKVMKFNEAMQSKDKEQWLKAVDEEYERFNKYNVFKAVKRDEVPEGAKVISTTWAMKKKASGAYRARMNMRGFEQKEGEHYDGSSISSPVTNDVSIRVALVLMLMANWVAQVVDVKGAFLHGEFENDEKIYTEVPQGFEKWFDPIEFLLLMLKTGYGLKQAARMFWKELLKAMTSMNFRKSKIDPCLYFKWIDGLGLCLWLSWIDDCLNLGKEQAVNESKNEMMKRFDCEDIGELKEYVGCKIDIDRTDRSLKITQPVLLQSYEDEFDLPEAKFHTPAEAGQVLEKAEERNQLPQDEQFTIRSGGGKLLHMMRWSRPETWNTTRDLSRRMGQACKAHMKQMLRIMKYCVDTPERGWTLKPSRSWDGIDKSFEFIVGGRADSDYANCKETRRSVSGYSVFLEDAPVSTKSGMQRIVALSTTEAETIAAVQCAQEMLYVMRLINSMELKVKLPMVLEIDNKGAVDLSNSWSVSGGTKHMEVRYQFLRELKQNGLLKVHWIPGTENDSDLFTKNLDRKTFEKHVRKYCGDDKYMKQD